MISAERGSNWRVLILIAIVAIAARWQTFGNPVLEYDEQFYLLVGDRMWQGMLPFVDIFDRKPFGLFLIYAAIRGLGGDGVLQYQLVWTAFAVATAFLIYRFARKLTRPIGAIAPALLYVLWLDINEGEGGQTPVFFNLAMMAAATLTWSLTESSKRSLVLRGGAAMLLVGIAIQVKYTPVVEGAYFGIVLMWAAWTRRIGLIAIGQRALLWIACALLPTIAVGAYYRSIGYWDVFWFCNFQSQFGRGTFPLVDRMIGLAQILGLLAPLIFAIRRVHPEYDAHRQWFVIGWLATALASLLVFGGFVSTHYGLPVLVPAMLAASPFFAQPGWGQRTARILGVFVLVAGQVVLAANEWRKGGAREASIVAKAATPTHGCIYVYDGYPALYQLTHSCLPTRYIFPSHLNTSDEGHASAIGVDPVVELRRILDNRPEVIVDDRPIFRYANLRTRAILAPALARDYHLVLRLRTGEARDRLVYRINALR